MSNTKLNLIILGLVLSPVWVGLLASIDQPSTSVSGLGVVGGAVLGTPFIAVVGLVISFLHETVLTQIKHLLLDMLFGICGLRLRALCDVSLAVI